MTTLATADYIENSPYLTTKEAAAYLRRGVGYLAKFRSKGGGPLFSKDGGRVVYDVKDLDAWRAAQKTTKGTGRPMSEKTKAALAAGRQKAKANREAKKAASLKQAA